MQIVNLMDFRGGYFTDTPSELMKDNELLKAENCRWRNGVVKRNGIAQYSTSDWSGFEGIKGAIRVYANSAWVTIIALDDGSDVNFYYGAGTTFAAIDNDFDWPTGYNVEFAELDGKIVAVNGQSKPAVIYYDSGWTIENLETYDTRDWPAANSYAGQWDASESPEFVDDSTSALDATETDFNLATTTNNDGFYISCDYIFNKVVFYGAEQASGSPVAEYSYWNGSSWTTLTLTTTPSWTAAEGTKTLEFNLPLDSDGVSLWKTYTEEAADDVFGVPNRYILRVRFTTAPSAAFDCDYVTIHNTQYLTLILFGAYPHAVYVHNGTMFLAERWIVNFSPYQSVKGWREFQTEYFEEGGRTIQQMISYKDMLVVLKENTVYTFNTSSLTDPVRSRPLSSVGAISGRSAAVVGGLLFFVSSDGIYAWDGSREVNVSKHIKSDLDTYTLSKAAGVYYDGEYWVSFPDESITLTADPDTFRVDSAGNGVVSFFKFTGYKSNKFLHESGAGDNGYLLALVDEDPPAIDRCDNGVTDGGTAISMTAKTKFYNFTGFQYHKFLGRFKPKIKQVSAATGSSHTLNYYSEDGVKTALTSLSVSVGSGFYSTDISLPYSMDGKNISFEMYHNGPTSAGLIGYAVELVNRRF